MTVSFTNATTRTSAAELTAAEAVSTMIIDAVYSTTVMRPLVRNDSLAGEPTNVQTFPAWPALTAAAIAETADGSNTQIDTTDVSITVGEIISQIALTDALQEDDVVSGVAPYARQCGRAVADKMDADLAALLAGFSNTTGTTGTALTVERFLAAIRALEARDVPGPYAAVLHPVQAAQLGVDEALNGGNYTSQFADMRFGPAERGFKGVRYGVPVYQTTNVTNDGTDYSGGIFAAGSRVDAALAFVSKREVRTEFERDASARLTEAVVTARYGVGEIVDTYGQELLSSMTA